LARTATLAGKFFGKPRLILGCSTDYYYYDDDDEFVNNTI
jgi:hypothetical protein